MIRHSEETKLAHAAISALKSLGYECIRVNSGNRPGPGGGYIHGAKKGTPDWLVVCPYVWIEFKDLTNPNPYQTQWHTWASRCGIPVIVARSVADAVRGVQRHRAELQHFEPLRIEEPKAKVSARKASRR